jgi:hypothetical protein
MEVTEKRENFLKYKEQRLKKAIAGIDQLSKLSSPAYEWSPDEITKMADDLGEDINKMLKSFQARRAWRAQGGE